MTRRTLINTVALGIAGVRFSPAKASGIVLHHEAHSLARESARGFRIALGSQLAEPGAAEPGRTPCILAGLRWITPRDGQRMLEGVHQGRWLLIESGLDFASAEESRSHRSAMRDIFGLDPGLPLDLPELQQSYVHYRWPLNRMLRRFSEIRPLAIDPAEAIAVVGNWPVAVRRKIGKGGIIYLGTPLGPMLLAKDPDAMEIAAALAYYCRSTV